MSLSLYMQNSFCVMNDSAFGGGCQRAVDLQDASGNWTTDG